MIKQPQAELSTSSERRLPVSFLWIGLAVISGLALAVALVELKTTWLLAATGTTVAAFVLWRGWPRLPLALVILASFLQHISLNGAVEASGGVNVRPEQAAALGIGLLLLAWLTIRRRSLVITLPGACATAWLVINVLAAFTNAPDLGDALKNCLRLTLMVTTFLLVINLTGNRQIWQWAIVTLLALGVAEDAYGILARVLYPGVNLGVQWYRTNINYPVPYGTMEEGNIFGSHTASWLLALVTLGFYKLRQQGLWRITLRRLGYVLALGIVIIALALSLARGAWVGLAAGAVVVFLWESPNPRVRATRLKALLIAVPLALVAAALLIWLAPANFPVVERLRTFTRLGSDVTFSARLEDWGRGLDDWQQHPIIGWGPGTYFQLHGLIRYNPAWISNLAVRTLQETGILGSLPFWACVLLPWFWVLYSLRNTSDNFARAATVSLAAGWACLLVAYQATDGFWLAAPWIHLGLMVAGVRLGIEDGNRENAQNDARMGDS